MGTFSFQKYSEIYHMISHLRVIKFNVIKSANPSYLVTLCKLAITTLRKNVKILSLNFKVLIAPNDIFNLSIVPIYSFKFVVRKLFSATRFINSIIHNTRVR